MKRPTRSAKKPARTKKVAEAASPATVLVLRTCDAEMKSFGGFLWPKSGPVACSDWGKDPVCGQGLHGLLWGEGNGELCSHALEANWLVVEVVASEIVSLGDKVKFPRGTVVFCGSAFDATKYIAERAPNTVRAIVRGTSTSGYMGTSTSGDRGTSTSGYRGTSTSGYRGTSTSGDMGEIRIKWWDEKTNRYRTAVGYIGERGLKANTPYKLNAQGEFIEAVK